ncbi:MAG: hypothetical protein ABIC40_01965, partial [bacterium]
MKRIYTIFLLVAFSLFAAISGCGGKKGQLVIGDIQGPSTVDESSKTEFSISATGDDGIKFEWACDPATSGYFTNRVSNAAIFNAALVDKDKPVEIRAMVSSINHSPVVKTLAITVRETGLA